MSHLMKLAVAASVAICVHAGPASQTAQAQYYPGWGYGYSYAPGPFFTTWRPAYAPPASYASGYYSAGYYGTRVVGYGAASCCPTTCCSPCDPCGGCNACGSCNLCGGCGPCSACGVGGCATGACGVTGGVQNMKPENDPEFEGNPATDSQIDPPPAERTYDSGGRSGLDDEPRTDPSDEFGRSPMDDFGNPPTPRPGDAGPAAAEPFDDGLGGGASVDPSGMGGDDFGRFRTDDGLPPFESGDTSRTSNKPPMSEPQAEEDAVKLPTGEEGSSPVESEATEEGDGSVSGDAALRVRGYRLAAELGSHREVIASPRLATERRPATTPAVARQQKNQTPLRWISAPRSVTRL
jgi:hypothetical protein